MKNIKADINNNSFKRVYLLCGEETYLLRRCLNELKKAVLAGDESDVNYSFYDGARGFNINEMKEMALTLPFFADRRLVVVENGGLFGSDSGFADFIAEIPETTVLILVEAKADKRTSLYKEIKKSGYVCEFATPQPQQLVEFAAKYLAGEGKGISRSDCEYLVSNVGGDMYNLTSELDKVTDYTGSRNSVTRADIDAVCSMRIENKIFDLVDAMMDADRQGALKIYFDLIALREQPIGLLRYIQKQYLRLLMIREGMDSGAGDSAIASELHMQDWLIRKYRARLKNCSRGYLLAAVEGCARTEEAIKSGDIPDATGTELLVQELCRQG